MDAALKAGRWCRRAPRGYRNSRDEENKPAIIPGKDAAYLRKIFEGISKGKTQSEMRIGFHNEGYHISKSNFSALLRNSVYIGKIRVPARGEKPEQIVEGLHEGIVEERVFLSGSEYFKWKYDPKVPAEI